MRFRGVQTILFTGIATEYVLEHSARDASIRGFYTVVVLGLCLIERQDSARNGPQ